MTQQTAALPGLADLLWPATDSKMTRLIRNATLVVVGSLLITAAAKLQVPFYPVPMTMQTFVILTLAMAVGPRVAMATVLFYLAQGAVGLPVFAGTPEKGIGIAYMIGGTGGYLVGFVLAAGLCGWLAERGWDRRPSTTAAAMLLGNALIYIPGVLWLGALFGFDKPILEWGLVPFLLGDVTKLLLATATMPLIWRWVKRRGS